VAWPSPAPYSIGRSVLCFLQCTLQVYIYLRDIVFSSAISLLWSIWIFVAVVFESELGRGREGLRAVGMGTWRKA
jgi:hypothetical protein